jgi:hypothetical protein
VGQPYTGHEYDLDAQNRVTRYAFTGVIGQSYSAYEYDYRSGFFAGSKYFFTNVTGQAYTAYEHDYAQGALAGGDGVARTLLQCT